MFPTPIQKSNIFLRGSYKISLIVAIIIWLLPLLAIMLTSIRSTADINRANYWGIPSEVAIIENYTEVFMRTPMLRYFLNSLIITLPVVIVCISISAMAGFSLAVYKFRSRLFLFALLIAGNFIPFQILMIPVRTLTIRLGIYDTWWALVFFHIAFQSGFATFFLRNFIAELPTSILESARIEGAGEWRIFLQIIVPLIRPALASLSVLTFTFIWNDFFWGLTLVQSDQARPITVGLQALRGQWVASWNLISAGSVIAALPPVIIFFLMQRQFIQGLTMGAIAGE